MLRRFPTVWKMFMLGASYFFYGWWDWRFLGLLAASSLVNHACARGMARRGTSPGWRRTLIVLAVLFNLGTIAFFKYYGFFIAQAYSLGIRLGIPVALPLLDIILPVGISFFTFQALSYVIDVYRGDMPPAPSLLDFALYLSFFPQLVAGPIVRARELIPQLSDPRPAEVIDTGRAACLILGGLFKKVVIANYLASAIVDPVFALPSAYGALDSLVAVYAYAVQIYCDFSAYSDMAIGFCLLLGIHIPINFDAPYLSPSIRGFWRRWHISLSSFLRDYLYIPLGGSRRGPLFTARNLMITFLLGGLWHGAGWTFIAWGALHGVYLTVERGIGALVSRIPAPAGPSRPRRILAGFGVLGRTILVFHLVCLAWLFFRGQTFADALEMVRAFTRWSLPSVMLSQGVMVTIVLGFASQFLDNNRAEKLWDGWARLPVGVQGALGALGVTLIFAIGPRGIAPFIYFQF